MMLLTFACLFDCLYNLHPRKKYLEETERGEREREREREREKVRERKTRPTPISRVRDLQTKNDLE